MSAQRVAFTSQATTIVGYFFPAAARSPCVVLAQGFSGTQDRLFDVAGRFSEAGFAALTFDYRSFGESSGEPRQVVSIAGQLRDIGAAVAFARDAAEVDPERIALWGSSLGGAHAIVAAAGDPRIAAVIAQMPFNGFPSRVEGRSSAETRRLMAAMLRDAIRGWLGRSPHYIPMIGGPGEVAVTSTADAQAYLDVLTGERRPRRQTASEWRAWYPTTPGASATWRNQVAPRGLLEMMRYRPERWARKLSSPLLVCAAESDEAAPLERVRRLAEVAPRGALRAYPGTHFEFYRDAAVRTRLVGDQIAFLLAHLGGGT